MLKFIYTEEGGRDIEMTIHDYPYFEEMCGMFRDFVAARGFDTKELVLVDAFDDEAFEDISVDTLCEEWREDIQLTEGMTPEQIVEATIDALVFTNKYYVRRFK